GAFVLDQYHDVIGSITHGHCVLRVRLRALLGPGELVLGRRCSCKCQHESEYQDESPHRPPPSLKCALVDGNHMNSPSALSARVRYAKRPRAPSLAHHTPATFSPKRGILRHPSPRRRGS